MKYKRPDHLIKILLKYFKGIAPIAIYDLVETLWPNGGDVKQVTYNVVDNSITIINNDNSTTVINLASGVAGYGMDYEDNDPVTLGLPSTIDSTTENAVTETSHTHALGEIDAGNVIVTAADEYVLYNWWVSEGDIAPDGWHVPSQAEWETLLDGIDTKITDGSRVYWANAKNILEGLGFNFIYEGRRNNFTGQGTFDGIYEMVYAMTTSDYTLEETVLNHITTFQADKNNTFFQINAEVKGSGVGLLLIKDDSTDPGTLEDYDGNIYNTVKVGDQVWITSNFRCTCYSDGTPIPLVQDNVAWTELITAAYCIYKQPLSDVITSLENQPDEKIKYDAADPTAGYLSEKIIAGANITITEGTGADENKLKIAASDTAIKVAIDFVDADELEFVYNCPVALKFTSQESEGADATISPALNTNMAQYGKVTITASEVGLIVLNGETL